MKSISIVNIPEKTYFRLLELKAKLEANDWVDFLEKVLKEMMSDDTRA